MYQDICVDIFTAIYELYNYYSVGFSTILHHVANTGKPVTYTHNKFILKIFLPTFDLFKHIWRTITGQDIMHQMIFI